MKNRCRLDNIPREIVTSIFVKDAETAILFLSFFFSLKIELLTYTGRYGHTSEQPV